MSPTENPQGTNNPGPSTSLIARVLGLVILTGILGMLSPFVYRFVEFRTGHSITDDAFIEVQMVHVSPDGVSGRLTRISVRENDTVKKGQVLFEIDPVNYKDQVAMAETKLQMAFTEKKRQEIALDKISREVPLAIAIARQSLELSRAEQAKMASVLQLTREEVAGTIQESEALVGVATANRILAQQEYDRFATLYKENAITLRRAQEVSRTNEATKAELQLAESKKGKAVSARAQIVVARLDLDAATSVVEKGKLGVSLAETGMKTILEAEQMLRFREEAVREAQTLLQTARHHLEKTKITAPISGIVVKRMKNTGDHVTMGLPILTMYDPDLMFVTANMEETRLKGIAPGNKADVYVDATGETLKGRVLWLNRSTGAEFSLLPRNVVSGEFTKVVQRVPIRILLDHGPGTKDIRAGLSVRATITHGQGDPKWVQKAQALENSLDSRFDETGPEKGE